MSLLDTKQALIKQLKTANINTNNIDVNDIAFTNKTFDPKNKVLWYSANFIPASSEMMGKTQASGNEERGIFQVSVFIPLNQTTYDDEQLSAIDQIAKAFKYNTVTTFNNQSVTILDITPPDEGIETGGWFQRIMSINYLTFSTR